MAQLPRCFECSKFNIDKMNCSVHSGSIPKDVLNETVSCDLFKKMHKHEENEGDYPIAEGR